MTAGRERPLAEPATEHMLVEVVDEVRPQADVFDAGHLADVLDVGDYPIGRRTGRVDEERNGGCDAHHTAEVGDGFDLFVTEVAVDVGDAQTGRVRRQERPGREREYVVDAGDPEMADV